MNSQVIAMVGENGALTLTESIDAALPAPQAWIAR
jgi:hypothetical protein